MCGIAGYLDNKKNDFSSLLLMSKAMRHRGPDFQSTWHDKESGIGFAHSRLSIIDLSPAGNQPMHSHSERWVLIFNGEIYNHVSIRKKLENSYLNSNEKIKWKGRSDTETLVNAIDYWGIEKTLANLEGMFAFALWDKKNKELTLVRDRIGEKPLYYGWNNKKFFFASELETLNANPDFKRKICRDNLSLLVRYGYIPCPYSIYEGIFKLLPGSSLTISLEKHYLEPKFYWKSSDIVSSGIKNFWQGTEKEATLELEKLLTHSIEQQMIADVPLGVFLSGGIDSSTVTAIMQSISDKPVHTFSIGFHEHSFNEAKYAKKVADHLGTKHTELYVSAKEALEVVPKLHKIYSEPFADSSQIPTFLVSQMTREHVKVALSGDGGDELFGGYNRYTLSNQTLGLLFGMPLNLRKFFSKVVTKISPQNYLKLFGHINKILPSGLSQSDIGNKIHKVAKVINAKSAAELNVLLQSNWDFPEKLVKDSKEPSFDLNYSNKFSNSENVINNMMATDLNYYLPDDILCKVDRAAMSVGLETRVPYLNHNIVKFAWQLPLSMKIKKRTGKWILRQILYKYVPEKIMKRPKMGFSLPLGDWLRGPLKSWANDLLYNNPNLEEYFNVKLLNSIWQEHLSKKKNHENKIWTILVFLDWLNYNKHS